MSITKKHLLSIALIIVVVLITVTIHDWVSVWHKEHYKTSKAGMSWGLLIHYYVFYIYPLVLFISSILIFNLKKREYLYLLPFITLLIALFAFNVFDRPYRTSLLAISMSLGYVVYFTCLLFINKRFLNSITKPSITKNNL